MEQQDIQLHENICTGCGAPLDRANHMPKCPVLLQSQETEKTDQENQKEVVPLEASEKITDEEGLEHDMATLRTKDGHSVRALFYGTEELPYNEDLLKGNQGFILGDAPRLRKKGQWDGFVDKVRSGSQSDESPTLVNSPAVMEAVQRDQAVFMVEKTPKHILDLAFFLGIDSEQLRNIRKAFEQNQMTDEAEAFMDKIIAAKVIDDTGNFRSDTNADGEMLMLQALQGDEKANNLLNEKVEILKLLDAKREREAITETRERADGIASRGEHEKKKEHMKLSDLVAVHATNFKPFRTANGMEVQTTYDGTRGQVPVDTIHFALNHHVASHMYGKWDSQPYVVLSPLEDLIAENGKPEALNTVDTYFEVTPGRKLALPQERSRSIMPEDLPPGTLYEKRNGGRVVYKKNALAPEDMKSLWEKYSPEERRHIVSRLFREIYYELQSAARNFDNNENESDRGLKTFQKFIEFNSNEEQDRNPDFNEAFFFKALQTEAPENVLNTILKKAGIEDEVQQSQKNKMLESFDSFFRSEIKNIAVNDSIKEMGFKVEQGGMWAWGDSWSVTDDTIALGGKLGIPVHPHSSSPMAEGRNNYLSSMNNLEEGIYTPKQYRESMEDDKKTYLPHMTPATRRMLYLRGML